LFPIVNPIGGAPIFLGLTRQRGIRDREPIARRVALNGFLLLLGSLFVGSYVLEFFGITLPIVRIAGGLVVSAFAWQLLHSGSDIDTAPAEAAPRPLGAADTFYPLTMPLTVGPGSIAVAITVGSQRPQNAGAGFIDVAAVIAGAVLGLAAIAATIYLAYRYAERTVSVLGEGGTSVLVRLSAFILLCIGIEIVWNGWSTLQAVGR
ncbi:MAG TPA: MarC family protein, partial [Bauldia sp.]|nr:MarC family protein [Bauldia sp.]